MNQSNKHIYVSSKDGNKNYVKTVNLTSGQITFDQNKEEALSINPVETKKLTQLLTRTLGNAHVEDDDR